MDEQRIQTELDWLAQLQEQRDAIAVKKQKQREAAIPQEILDLLAEIDKEFAPEEKEVEEKITMSQRLIKDAVVDVGFSVAGSSLRAEYARGRWSTSETPKSGYKPVTVYRKRGKPYVSIKTI